MEPKNIMEEIERMSYVVPASKEAIISGYKHILYGIMFDPFDEGEDLHGVWASGPSDVWTVGVHGTLRHFDGQG